LRGEFSAIPRRGKYCAAPPSGGSSLIVLLKIRSRIPRFVISQETYYVSRETSNRRIRRIIFRETMTGGPPRVGTQYPNGRGISENPPREPCFYFAGGSLIFTPQFSKRLAYPLFHPVVRRRVITPANERIRQILLFHAVSGEIVRV
jgi:hypothetical protein